MPTSAKKTDSKKDSPDRDTLVADLKALIEDASKLTSDAADATGEAFSEKVSEIQEQIKDAVAKLKEHGETVKDTVKDKSKESVDTVENLIRENPWKSVGIAVVAGILIDRLIRD